MKWAEKGIRHDLIFKFLRDTELINYYPELKLLKETPQDKIYHPEGDVEIHTEMTLHEMDKIILREKIGGKEKIILVMSILTHDIAKPQCTKEEMKRGRMTITSAGHESMGGDMCKEFLPRLGFPEELVLPISNLVANHLSGVSISMIDSRKGQLKAVKKLSRRLSPATIQQLLYVMEADSRGRGGDKQEITGAEILRELSAEADVQTKAYQPILMGRHLIELGLKPSPKFKEILDKSFEAQESGEFSDVEGGRVWLKNYLNTTI
jgi:tRNA nucleotidyltransferase (CCA-adding enzyme)